MKRLSDALALNGQDCLDAVHLRLTDSVPKFAGDFLLPRPEKMRDRR
jgi:hypothetical protein